MKTFLNENNFTTETALGMYIPNSYEFFWNTNAEEFRARMLKENRRFWNENRLEKTSSLGLKPTEVVTLASIVYEESKKAEEISPEEDRLFETFQQDFQSNTKNTNFFRKTTRIFNHL